MQELRPKGKHCRSLTASAISSATAPRNVILSEMSRSRKRTTHAVEGSLPSSRCPTVAGNSPEILSGLEAGTNLAQLFLSACIGLIAEALRAGMYPDATATTSSATAIPK